jgi:hypothetical protein
VEGMSYWDAEARARSRNRSQPDASSAFTQRVVDKHPTALNRLR